MFGIFANELSAKHSRSFLYWRCQTSIFILFTADSNYGLLCVYNRAVFKTCEISRYDWIPDTFEWNWMLWWYIKSILWGRYPTVSFEQHHFHQVCCDASRQLGNFTNFIDLFCIWNFQGLWKPIEKIWLVKFLMVFVYIIKRFLIDFYFF